MVSMGRFELPLYAVSGRSLYQLEYTDVDGTDGRYRTALIWVTAEPVYLDTSD